MKIEKCKHWRPYGISIISPDEERVDVGIISLYIFGHAFEWETPKLFEPFRVKVIPTTWDAETIARLGRNYYYNVFPKEYGFRVSDDFFQLFYGAQTHDSDTTQSWSTFIPWLTNRFIRLSFYDTNGDILYTEKNGRYKLGGGRIETPEWAYQYKNFLFTDFDGEVITAKCRIEEREWRKGSGWFSWLSIFSKPIIRRSLSIDFSAETGTRKGSWKGGTVGHGIEMLKNESCEAAFIRYCNEHDMKYLNEINELPHNPLSYTINTSTTKDLPC